MMFRINMGRLLAKSVQPSIRSVELPGEHHYNNKNIYLSVWLTSEILSIKLQTARLRFPTIYLNIPVFAKSPWK